MVTLRDILCSSATGLDELLKSKKGIFARRMVLSKRGACTSAEHYFLWRKSGGLYRQLQAAVTFSQSLNGTCSQGALLRSRMCAARFAASRMRGAARPSLPHHYAHLAAYGAQAPRRGYTMPEMLGRLLSAKDERRELISPGALPLAPCAPTA